MKKIFAMILTLALLLCGFAMAEGKTVKPMVTEIDLAAPADGIYAAYFAPADLGDGQLKFTIYTEDCYDIVDIDTLAVGDTIIAGGIDEGGFNLRPYDEDNCWKMALEDDYATWSEYGETTLPLADDVTFTDGWNIEKNPETTTGAEAVAGAITGTDMDYFSPLNTTVRVEGGKIVEIVRAYMP